jgi:putative membrane protein
VALLPLAAGWALGDARWRGAGWSLGDETLAVRSQLLARTTLLALARRVQRADVRSHPLQRRADLATFDVVLATGRHGLLRHLDASTADGLQRAVAARTVRRPPPAVRREGSLFFAAPPE